MQYIMNEKCYRENDSRTRNWECRRRIGCSIQLGVGEDLTVDHFSKDLKKRMGME